MLQNARQTASLYHHSAVNRLAQESLVDESWIFFPIPIRMKTLLKTNLVQLSLEQSSVHSFFGENLDSRKLNPESTEVSRRRFYLFCVNCLSMVKVPREKVNAVICDTPELTHSGELGCVGISAFFEWDGISTSNQSQIKSCALGMMHTGIASVPWTYVINFSVSVFFQNVFGMPEFHRIWRTTIFWWVLVTKIAKKIREKHLLSEDAGVFSPDTFYKLIL